MRSLTRKPSGGSLLEVIIALSILAFAVSAIYTTYTAALNQIGLGTTSHIAGEIAIQRLEALRGTNWNNITTPIDPDTTKADRRGYLQLLLTPPVPTGLASITSERITVTPLAVANVVNLAGTTPATPTVPTGFYVERTGNNAPIVSPATYSTSLASVTAVQVRVNITWLDRRNRTRQREICTVIARAGINP